MRLSDYQERTRDTAIYPEADEGTLPALTYVALGLAGEAGELANKVKKLMRDGDSFEAREAIKGEVGDVLWYLARFADEMRLDLDFAARWNLDKLASRKARGVIGGSGDTR